MTEILIVRQQRCEGCLYSTNSIAHNRAEGIKDIKDNPEFHFPCHCFSKRSVRCRGFYDAHPERFVDKIVRFTKKKGDIWQWYLHKVKAGMHNYFRPGLN